MRSRQSGFTLIEILVVITIIASLAGAVLILVPRIQEKQKATSCANHLRQLGALYTTEQIEKPGLPKYDGASLFLYYRKKFMIQKGDEEILMCPGDNAVARLDTQEASDRYDEIDLDDPPTDACSYMVRAFRTYPLNPEATDKQIIACDRNGPNHDVAHHRGGLNIVYEDGSVKFRDREWLGLSPNAPMVVGEGAENEDLGKVIYAPGKKE